MVTPVYVDIQPQCFHQILLHGTAVPSHFTKTDDPDKEQKFPFYTNAHLFNKIQIIQTRKRSVFQKIDYQCSCLTERG